MPTVRVLEPPQHGFLTVRRAELTTDKIAGCLQLKIPAQVVFYTGRDDYSGPDRLSYEVTDFSGDVGIFDVTITVKPAPLSRTPQAPTSSGKGNSL